MLHRAKLYMEKNEKLVYEKRRNNKTYIENIS